MQYQWVVEPYQLNHLVDQMQKSSVNVLDTEFIKVDTLYPKLGVLQVYVNQQVYLVDGQLDLTAIWPLIFQAQQNIFHACGEDIDLIYHYAGNKPLKNVFDSQIAMAFLGYGMQMGYQAALETILGVHVEKDQTRSDWLARPLSEEQMRYAATDVFYLHDLAEYLIAQLKDKDLYQYVLEDCQHYCAAIAEQVPNEALYLDIGNYRHSSRQLMQIKQIAAWREDLARRLNLPRSYIIKNNSLHKLLERTPKTMQQLANSHELKPIALREYGKDLLSLLNELPEPALWPERLPRPFRYQQIDTKDKLDAKIAEVSQQMKIPVDVLMRKKWLTQLNTFVAHDQQDTQQLNAYLRGWRYQHLTLPLLDILRQDRIQP